jgi:putative ABC transport system substrate-binding protein
MGAENVKTIGYFYSLGEKNSVVQLEALRAEAADLGVEVTDSGIANSSEVTTGIQALRDVDAIYVGTDNAVVNGLDAVTAFCEEHQIPLFVADTASVDRGGVATRGIDYYELGRRTGEMAYEILVNGKDPGSIPPLQVVDTTVYVNPAAAQAYGITIPQAILDIAEVTKPEE